MKDYPERGSMLNYDYDAPIRFDTQGWWSSGQFPADCVESCSGCSDNTEAVEFWVRKLNLVDAIGEVRDTVRRYLKEIGAWNDLMTADDETLAQRVLWLACHDIKEQGEWLGLVH